MEAINDSLNNVRRFRFLALPCTLLITALLTMVSYLLIGERDAQEVAHGLEVGTINALQMITQNNNSGSLFLSYSWAKCSEFRSQNSAMV